MTMNSDAGTPSVKEVCDFITRYCSWLVGCGATCIRVEKNVGRIARAYGKEADISIMPRHVHVSVVDDDSHESMTSICKVKNTPISFNINTRLSELSWEIADGKVDFGDAVRRFDEIVDNDSQNCWIVLLLVTLANASFWRLFGGDFTAMAIVGVATAVGYFLKLTMLSRGIDMRVVFIACSFVSAVLGATDVLFSLGDTPLVALGTSVLYLVPGIPFLNSFSDMLYRHYICAISRFTDAVVLTCCLSIGLCGGMMLMNVGMF